MRRIAMMMIALLLSGGIAHASAPVPRLKPEAPVSTFISNKDETILRAVFESIDDRRYEQADTLRRQIDDRIARAIADWAYLRQRNTEVPSAETTAFLDAYYGWPNDTLIQQHAEEAFDEDTPAAEIATFFSQRDPVTGNGHLQLARIFFERGNQDAGIAQLRKAWIDFDWSTNEEREILRRYGQYLTENDHWEKADRQLFEIKATVTTRLLPYLSPDKRAEAATRIAFLRLDGNAPGLYANLAQTSAQDSGVLHAATRYYRRLDRDAEALTYASLAPLDSHALRNADAWFTERRLLTRWALKTGRFDDAYTLSAYSGLEDGADFAEAEFLAGWVALRFLNDPERAKAHFAFLSTGVTSPISLSRGEYWLARAWEASGNLATAEQHYRVAAAYPYTYYGQLAIEKLGPSRPRDPFPEELPEDPVARDLFEARPMVHAMRILAEIDEDWHFDRFARALDDQLSSEGEVSAYFDLVMGERKTYLAVRAGKVARNNGVEVPSVIYPVIPVPLQAEGYAEAPLILGLSRQESEFNPQAYSRAKARGLMQLLASTARITARKEGFPYSTSRLMSDPAYNMVIGAAHLSHLLERFNGSYIMVLAGYNAGPHRVTQWVETYGDPRDPSVDPIDWIELIPFSETRNYVMRVLENTQVYRARLEGEPIGGRLTADLIRGGNSADSFGIVPPAPTLWQVSDEDGGGPNLMNRPGRPPLAVDRFPNGIPFPPLHREGLVPVSASGAP